VWVNPRIDECGSGMRQKRLVSIRSDLARPTVAETVVIEGSAQTALVDMRRRSIGHDAPAELLDLVRPLSLPDERVHEFWLEGNVAG
jgi:hypothetical protein